MDQALDAFPVMTNPGREYLFGTFRLNVSTRQLWHGDQEVMLPLKAFECLVYLIEHRARAVSRTELFQTVWRNVHLTENVLDQTIFVLRRTLDNTTPDSPHIKTVRGFGYHWIAPVECETTADPAPALPPETPRPFDRWKTHRWLVFLLVPIALVMLLLMTQALWDSRQTTNDSWKSNGATIALVLPANVSAESKSWIRYGAMDLVSERLRSAGLAVVPSETTIALMQRLKIQQFNTNTMQQLSSATGATLVLHLDAQEKDARWNVTLRSEIPLSTGPVARGEAGDVFEATRIAADRLALSLGLTPAPVPIAGTGALALARQLKAAILASQPEVASTLLAGADDGLRQHPEVRFQASRLDYYLERFDAAESQLRSLVDAAAVSQDPVLHSRVIVGLSAFAFRRQEYAAAEALLESALGLVRSGNHSDQVCSIASKMGLISLMRGELDRARSRLANALLECEETGSIDELGNVENSLGSLETVAGNHDQSIVFYQRAARDLARTYSIDYELGAQSNLAEAYLEKADLPAAALAVERLDQLLGQSSQQSNVQMASLTKIHHLIAVGKLSEARQLLANVGRTVAVSNQYRLALLKAQLADASGRTAETAELASEAAGRSANLDILLEASPADAWLLLIRARIALKQHSEAHEALTAMTAWANTIHASSARILLLLARAEVAEADGLQDEAGTAYEEVVPLIDTERSNRLRILAADSHIRWLLSHAKGRPALDRALAVANRIATDDTYESALVRLRLAQAMGAQVEWRKALARAHELAGERTIPLPLLQEPVPR